MTFYLDTSVIVASLFDEKASPQVLAWLETNATDRFEISDWTITEMSAALSIKVRTRQIDDATRKAALAMFGKTFAERLVLIPVAGDHFRRAAQFADRHPLGLRAGDALHLAIASSRSATVATLDRRLAAAGPEIGVPTYLVA